ncbi:unnamed protein product [Phytophthora lilii]|uniref:Unnamed protein product n=1 Tax=Phytophthora lilii TaxID=2077276 RepID=A0A9W6U035_9STRA|nr:unnamed protein product [Phytophthora lilii]
MAIRLLRALAVVVFAVVACEPAPAQSYTFNKTAAAARTPVATVMAANFTVNGTATISNTTVFSLQAGVGNNSDVKSVDYKEERSILRSDNDSSDSDDKNDSDSSDSDDDTDSSLSSSVVGSASSSGSSFTGFTIGNALNATSTIKSTYKNWVGSALGTAKDTACYREAHIAKHCPLGFDGKLGTCWAQCPFSYPVECGMECIRQNDDCALEIVSKVSSVAQAALSLATYGLYGEFKLMAKGLQIAFKCGKEMMGLVKALSKYVRTVQVSDPQTSQEQLLTMLYQTDNVVFDIPVTIMSCLGIKVNEQFKFADRVLNTAELALKEVIANGATIVSSWSAFTNFMKNITLGESISSLNETDITSLKSALKSNSTCGYDMKRLLDRTWMTVAEMRRQNPGISEDDIRVAMSKSNLALYEIPTVTNNCMEELIAESSESAAYTTRDTLRKSIGGIMDDLISSGTSNNGTFLSAGQYAYKIADKVATFYAVWDRSNMMGAVSEFFQTICGPTEYVGEIDDGTAKEALGLKTVERAFNNSAGNWTKIGDGAVTITFNSTDTEDVTVNIKSGGDKIAEVAVPSGKTVTWSSNVTALGGKTLYLDRWRPGFLGLPGTGGGSLLLWVPRSTQGGSFQLTAMLNVS